MKLYSNYKFLSFLFCVIISHTCFAQIIINGIAKNYTGSSLVITKASEYELFPTINRIRLADSTFRLIIDSDQPVVINVTTPTQADLPGVYLIAEPNDSIHLSLDFLNDSEWTTNSTCQFTGNNAEGHRVFHDFESLAYKHYTLPIKEQIASNKDTDDAYEAAMNELDRNIQAYRLLLENNQISETYFKIVEQHIKTALLVIVISDIMDDDFELLDNSINRWELADRLLQHCATLEGTHLLAGQQINSAASSYINRKKLKIIQSGHSSVLDTTVVIDGEKYHLNGAFAAAPSIQKELYQELYFAHWLKFFYTTMVGYAEIYDDKFEYFKKRFPNSSYITELERIRTKRY